MDWVVVYTELHSTKDGNNKKYFVKNFDDKSFVYNFDKNVIVMKNVVGNPARGENFFPREREIQKVISRIEGGNNLQIAAPRRIGKTSILFYLLDNNVEGYTYVYVDTERVDNEQEYYKKILKEILKVETISKSTKLKSLLEKGGRFLSKIKSIKVLGHGVDFHEDEKETDYYEELRNFLSGFQLEGDTKLVLLIDEFPQTIINIVEANKGDLRQATQFLQSNRELRHNPEINSKVQFIYTGSIGLNHTVSAINASAFINDLNSVEVEPLTYDEGSKLVKQLLTDKGIVINKEAVETLLKKVDWLIPFHIQLAIQEVINLAYGTNKVDEALVNKAFDKIVEARNNNHFEHYYRRLKSQFKGKEFGYVDELLQRLATEGTLEKSMLYDMAVGFKLEERYGHIIDILAYDGYINNTGNIDTYRFNSPIVRMWWQKFICK